MIFPSRQPYNVAENILNISDILRQSDPNTGQYTVTLPEFYGPMDLLSTLIEQKDLEITKISLAQVTDQYLAYLKILQELTLDALTDFLVIAAKLILIKSEILLPAPPAKILNPVTDEASDEDLGQQLRDYKRFKHVTTWLEERQDQQQRCFIRISPPPRNPTFRPLISTLRPC